MCIRDRLSRVTATKLRQPFSRGYRTLNSQLAAPNTPIISTCQMTPCVDYASACTRNSIAIAVTAILMSLFAIDTSRSAR